MEQQPLYSSRLLLREFSLKDADNVQLLAGNYNVSRYTSNIPYPYRDGMAETWIQSNIIARRSNLRLCFAITITSSNTLIGAISLEFENKNASLGYWIGEPFWNQGYCTEAVITMLDYGLNKLNINKIYATHLAVNPASGRVMQKAGMHLEKKVNIPVRQGNLQPACIYVIERK